VTPFMPRVSDVEKARSAAASASRITTDTPANSPLRAAALLRDELLADWIRHGLTRRQIAHILDAEPPTVYHWCNANEQRKRRDAYRAALAEPRTLAPDGLPDVLAELVDHRRKRGLSVPDLARRIGVSATTLLAWERGETAPRLHNLLDWAQSLGLQVTLREDSPR
jgi:DNA-binding XRE family transcriptional regulator